MNLGGSASRPSSLGTSIAHRNLLDDLQPPRGRSPMRPPLRPKDLSNSTPVRGSLKQIDRTPGGYEDEEAEPRPPNLANSYQPGRPAAILVSTPLGSQRVAEERMFPERREPAEVRDFLSFPLAL